MAYKPGDYYITDSGNVRVWDGDSWIVGGVVGTPQATNAIRNGKAVSPPGAAAGTPNADLGNSPVAQAARQQAAAQPPSGTPVEKYELFGPQDSDLGGTGSLRYPNDSNTFQSSDYMIFDFYSYKPPFSKDQGGGLFSYDAYNKSATNLGAKQLTQIILYMPEDVSVSYQAEWTGKKFGNIAAGLLQTAGNVGGGDIGKAIQNLSSTAGGTVKRAPAQIGASAVSAIVSGITGESVGSGDIFSSIGGQILNPNTELIFGGHDLRTFTFTYKLVAYNKPESDVIKRIIQVFKTAMLPSFNPDGVKYSDLINKGEFEGGDPKTQESIGFIKNPLLVQPYFMHKTGIHQYLPRFKPCTITSFDANYTADGVYAAYADGSPVAATITISLLETKLVYAEDIAKGF